jgi:hypothetical protein
MNKILSDIAKEALVEHCISHVRLQAFAELIVRECAQICQDQPNHYALKTDRDNCAVAIKEHFGLGKDMNLLNIAAGDAIIGVDKEYKLAPLADADAFAHQRKYTYIVDEDSSNSR